MIKVISCHTHPQWGSPYCGKITFSVSFATLTRQGCRFFFSFFFFFFFFFFIFFFSWFVRHVVSPHGHIISHLQQLRQARIFWNTWARQKHLNFGLKIQDGMQNICSDVQTFFVLDFVFLRWVLTTMRSNAYLVTERDICWRSVHSRKNKKEKNLNNETYWSLLSQCASNLSKIHYLNHLYFLSMHNFKNLNGYA